MYNIIQILLIKTKMKTKIKIIFSIFLLSWSAQSSANELIVQANIDSGNYDFALEVYLNSNDKNAKIFYYTDGIGRFDTLKEFKYNNPIIIKKDTILNYYAINDLNNSTKIKESQYSFSYPKNIEISYKNDTIFLTNISEKTINIGFFKIESNVLNYEVSKNTFLKSWEFFSLKYIPKTEDVLEFFIPNGEKISRFEIKNTSEFFPSPDARNSEDNILTELQEQPLETSQSWSILNNQNLSSSTAITPLETQTEIIPTPIFSPENLKASAWETKNSPTNIYVLLYGFVAFLFAMTCYNIFTLIKTNRNIKNKNKKISKK